MGGKANSRSRAFYLDLAAPSHPPCREERCRSSPGWSRRCHTCHRRRSPAAKSNPSSPSPALTPRPSHHRPRARHRAAPRRDRGAQCRRRVPAGRSPRTRVRLRAEIAKRGRVGDVFLPDALPWASLLVAISHRFPRRGNSCRCGRPSRVHICRNCNDVRAPCQFPMGVGNREFESNRNPAGQYRASRSPCLHAIDIDVCCTRPRCLRSSRTKHCQCQPRLARWRDRSRFDARWGDADTPRDFALDPLLLAVR